MTLMHRNSVRQREGEPKVTEVTSSGAEKAAQGQAQPQRRPGSLTPAPGAFIVSSTLAGQITVSAETAVPSQLLWMVSGDCWSFHYVPTVLLACACSWGGRCSRIFPLPVEQAGSLLSGDAPASPAQILGDILQGLCILKGNFFYKFNTFH